MIDTFTLKDANSILQDTDGLRISMFTPMEIAGQQVRQNPIRFKNAMRAIDEVLENAGSGDDQREKVTEKLEPLLDDDDFWQNQAAGLAVFVSPTDCRYFRVDLDLEEHVYAGEQYQVLPLLPLCAENTDYHLLALSQNDVRLFRGNHHSIEELVLPDDVPHSLTDEVGQQVEEQHLQHHSGQGQSPNPIYHGQGGGKDDQLPELERFCRAIATGIEAAMNESKSRLILAGDSALLAIFKKIANGTLDLDDEILSGNFDRAKPEVLHDKVMPILHARRQEERSLIASKFKERTAMDQSSDIFDTIVAAAREGRVETLLVREMGGDPADKGPEATVPSTHLVNELVALCLENGGNIKLMDDSTMPTAARIAAIYRY